MNGQNKRVAVAMSGGVDSSVALLLLQKAGYEVVGFTAKLLGEDTDGSCCSIFSAYNARRVCDRLGVPHYMVNLKEPFYEKVLKRFVNEYRAGRTPNPCVDCNRFIKFKHFLKIADSLDCDYLATGHYARIIGRAESHQKMLGNPADCSNNSLAEVSGGEASPLNSDEKVLLKGVDRSKDQSYFVAVITRDEVKRILFPCGDFTKVQVREMASFAGLPTAKTPDSQDVCFLHGEHDLAYWIKLISGESPKPGVIKDLSGAELGEHPGIEYFTRGQRKRIGIATGEKKYVVDIEAEGRTLVVARRGEFPISEIELSHVNLLTEGYVNTARELSVRTRYRQREVAGYLKSLDDGNWGNEETPSLTVRFREPQEFVSPGQLCVFYDRELVVGCGIIENINTGS